MTNYADLAEKALKAPSDMTQMGFSKYTASKGDLLSSTTLKMGTPPPAKTHTDPSNKYTIF